MDQDRQIRFAIPPFFLIGSLLFGLFQSDNIFRTWLTSSDIKTEQLLAVGAAIAGSTLPIGFILSALAFLFLRILFFPLKRKFTARLSNDALEAIWPQMRSSKKCDEKYNYEAMVTLDHEILSPGIHSYLVRCWNAFLISVQSIMALWMAHGVACLFSLEQSRDWFILTTALTGLLIYNARVTWNHMENMLEFQAYRKHGKAKSQAHDNQADDDVVDTRVSVTNKLKGAGIAGDPKLSD